MLSTPAFVRLAFRHKVVDNPSPRRVNKKATARLGGPAMFLGFIVAMLFYYGKIDAWAGIVAGATIMFLLGVFDDVKGLRSWFKLFIHIVAASVAYRLGVRIEYITNPFGGGQISFRELWWLSYIITVFWIIGITNAVNLIDGLDGLAAGIICIVSITFFLVAIHLDRHTSAILAIIMVGVTGGFLRWNFYPAKVFMGDSGAYFLGYMAAVIAVVGAFKSTTAVTLVIPVLALGIPIFDTSFAIIRRYRQGQPIMAAADRGHLHHRLLDLGLHHRSVVVICYLITLALSIVSLALIKAWALALFLLLSVGVMILLLVVARRIAKKNIDSRGYAKSGR